MNPTRRLLSCLAPWVLLFAGCGGGGGDGGPAPAPRFTLGGSVSGLAQSGLVLANGTDSVSVAAGATTFTLPATIASGSTFSVAVQTQPAGQTCTVASGTGTMGNANVTTAAVTCTTNTFTVGGSISGLISSGLMLANGSDSLAVDANATGFTLPTAVNFGSAFSVGVQTQPTGLTCTVTDGSGTVGNANVSNAVVTCSANAFTLGGNIGGLASGGLVLANGSDTVSVAADATSFTMPAAVAFGSPYGVTVRTQAGEHTCSVSNGSGTMGPANVGDVTVSCVAASFSAVSTLAGSGQPGSADGSAAAATFNAPSGVVVDAAGNVYVAETGNNTIRKIAPNGSVSTFAGSGARGNANGVGLAASFNNPRGMAIDATGNLFVADAFNNQVRKITPAGVVTTIAGPFNQPSGLAFDGAGNLYVVDSQHHTIHKIAPDGTRIILAGTTGVAGSADGPVASATFSGPFGIAIDASGNLYVADRINSKIRKITPDGMVSTLAGTGTTGSTDGAGSTARFDRPLGIAVGASGRVYVADTNNHKIRVITPEGTVSTLAGSGTAGSTDGALASATFSGPFGIAIDGGGNVYVADTGSHKIRRIARD